MYGLHRPVEELQERGHTYCCTQSLKASGLTGCVHVCLCLPLGSVLKELSNLNLLLQPLEAKII